MQRPRHPRHYLRNPQQQRLQRAIFLPGRRRETGASERLRLQLRYSALDRRQHFVDGSQQRIRGSVNGNVLVPTAPNVPLSPPIPPRAPSCSGSCQCLSGTNSPTAPTSTRAPSTPTPRRASTNNGGIRLDQAAGSKTDLILRHQFTSQDVQAFQLIAGPTQTPPQNLTPPVSRGLALGRPPCRSGG